MVDLLSELDMQRQGNRAEMPDSTLTLVYQDLPKPTASDELGPQEDETLDGEDLSRACFIAWKCHFLATTTSRMLIIGGDGHVAF